MTLYVGNLVFSVTSDNLSKTFGQFGEVVSANVITDRNTGRSKGFAFVEMHSKEDGLRAISQMHDKEYEGRKLTVNQARPKEEKTSYNNRY